MADDKKDLKAESIEDLVSRITKSIFNEGMPALAVALKGTQPQAPQGTPRRDPGALCPTCGQGENACKKEHVKLVVYPSRYPEFGEFFQGVIINGVRYLSNNQDHEIEVPACAATEMSNIIRTFETNERETRVGRSKTHHSGSVHTPTPAQVGWR